mgnify:CR=1 FL=1|tara:strand:+ start:27779 stop:28792 length:1014 start_codon:yes stop_codon:yes gene_type:complete
MGKKYKFNEDEIKQMVSMYVNDFESTRVIADKYNVDPSVITTRLKSGGVIIPKGSAYSKQYWLDRGMSEEDIEYHIKKLRPVNIEYWVKLGYSEEEAILHMEGQKLVSLRGCVARFGEIDGTKVWNEREGKRRKWGKMGSTNIQYWMNKGYSDDEAKIKLSERQTTFSKEICIEKYGEVEGLKVFTERQRNWSKSLNENGNMKMGYSKISQELFYELLGYYDVTEKESIKFATHNGELKLDKDNGGIWLYDFVDLTNKKIIEYNGDMYHGNPRKYLAEDCPHPFSKDTTAQEMWDKDELKLEVAKNNGYETLVIWDSEYRWGNKQKIVDKCVKFLNN